MSKQTKDIFGVIMCLIDNLFDMAEYVWPFDDAASTKMFEAESLIREWYLWPDEDVVENLENCLNALSDAARLEGYATGELSAYTHKPYNTIQSSITLLKTLIESQNE